MIESPYFYEMHKYSLHQPGTAPGIEHEEITSLPSEGEPAVITCIDYCPAQAAVETVEDLDGFVARHRPEWSVVRWISVEGMTDMRAIHALATKYDLHPLAVEDLLHQTQRAKVDAYGGEESGLQARLFLVAQGMLLDEGRLRHEQVSIFLGHRTVLTFQRREGLSWEQIRQRIRMRGSRLRCNDASFLAYSLIDALVDECFPILEHFSDRAEELEMQILEGSRPEVIKEIHQLKRELLLMHRLIWPLREVIAMLQRDPHECLSETTRVYLHDLYDHVIQIIEILETYRELASDLTETYMSSASNRMNEVMKLLTLISTIFIPLTFLAGVYGMNFHYLPELGQVWAYPAFWAVCALLAGVMALFFRRRRWL